MGAGMLSSLDSKRIQAAMQYLQNCDRNTTQLLDVANKILDKVKVRCMFSTVLI